MRLAERTDDLLAHIIWGSFPAQEFWENNLIGYDSRKGVNMSAVAEILACGVVVLNWHDYAILGVLDALLAGTRINMPMPRRGMYALEIPYETLKFIGQAAFSNVSR